GRVNARTRLILTVVASVVVILLAYFLLIRPRQGELSDVQAQVETEENLTLELRGQLEALQQLQRNAPQLQADLDRIRDLVPQDHEVPNFIFQVNAAAAASGVEIVQLTPELPKQPPEGAQLAQVRITIGGEGGYFAIQDFVRRLYSLDRAVRIDVLDLSALAEETGGTTGGITMTAAARIFFEAPTGVTGIAPTTPATPVTPTAPPATPAPDPAASPTAAATP
ncbi:MAG TPA: type 4a pilus biogenesis protein PilO, partial [Actinomycetota bacterium]|nr:type 4a pilus biogenesis protein PilO [Actinomycetota bacterium]